MKKAGMSLKNKRVLITGASFIGVHLIGKLYEKGVASIRVVNLTRKHKPNLKPYAGDIEFLTRDLRSLSAARKSVRGTDVVVHLAADHGGRGYVALKQGHTASNFLLDGSVFKAALETGVEKVFFASSGCVYPNYQQSMKDKKLLKEGHVTPPYDADNIYGWAKLMGELTLRAYHKDFGLPSAIGRFFTVYGPHASESHAVMATIAKAFIRQDPFPAWGDGKQVRNWTYVEDIVDGIILGLERISDGTAVNLGTEEKITVTAMIEEVCRRMQFRPRKIVYQTDMPVGPPYRVADISLARSLLGWSPAYGFTQGLAKTVDWYTRTKNKEYLEKNLDKLLI